MDPFWTWSAAEISKAVREKEVSATEVTVAHLDRLAQVNPSINAVVQEFPQEALRAAQAVDDIVARGEDPGVLAGVPVTTKVNVDQKGVATTNGLRIQQDLIAETDSPVVSNMRKAGAVIVGRTNTPAFSLRWFTNNALHGQTLNPRDKSITPGGSSGGAAAAVASGICAIGHGTDIAGSIRYPAYACGLHGLRPTLGRVPAHNASAPDRYIGAQLMAVSGPIGRSISDLELAFLSMSAPDARDPWYVPPHMGLPELPRRVAMVVAPDGMPVSSEVKIAVRAAAQSLSASGWTVEEITPPSLRLGAEINAILWMAETKSGAGELIAREAEPESQFVFEEMTRYAGEVGLDTLMNALQSRATLMRQWDLFFQDFPVVLCPVSGELPFEQQKDVSSPEAFAEIFEAQMTQRGIPAIGAPALSVATGCASGRPVGVQLLGPRFREDILMAAARDIEAASDKVTVATPDWE